VAIHRVDEIKAARFIVSIGQTSGEMMRAIPPCGKDPPRLRFPPPIRQAACDGNLRKRKESWAPRSLRCPLNAKISLVRRVITHLIDERTIEL
jgi:hypothetical protein